MNATLTRQTGTGSANGANGTTLPALSEDQAEILRLARTYGGGKNGHVDWKRAWREEPEMAKRLNKGTPVQTRARLQYALKQFRKLGYSLKAEPGAQPESVDTKPLTDHQREILELVKPHVMEGGSVNWKAVWAANPAAHESKVGRGPKRFVNMQLCYSALTVLRKKGFLPATGLKPNRAKRGHHNKQAPIEAQPVAQSVTQVAPPPESRIRFCPCCGESLQPYIMAERMLAKMA